MTVDGTSKEDLYVLYPGAVVSKSDGDEHYIGVAALERLYCIPRGAIKIVQYEHSPRVLIDIDRDKYNVIECRPLYSDEGGSTAMGDEEKSDRGKAIDTVNSRVVMMNKHVQRLMHDIQIEGLSDVRDEEIYMLRTSLTHVLRHLLDVWDQMRSMRGRD